MHLMRKNVQKAVHPGSYSLDCVLQRFWQQTTLSLIFACFLFQFHKTAENREHNHVFSRLFMEREKSGWLTLCLPLEYKKTIDIEQVVG